jgi:hypothetical protein
MPPKYLTMAEGKHYSVPDIPVGGVWHIHKRDGTVYRVRPGLTHGGCDCPDYTARGHQRACKHVDWVNDKIRSMPWLPELIHERSRTND